MTVCWTTDQAAQGSVHLMNDDGTTIRTLSTPSAATHQEIVIDGLQPNRHYRYEVQLARRGARPLGGTFTTSPSPGTPCELVAWGDSRSNPETCKAIADLILKSGAPLCLHSGDFVSQGYNPDEWDRMFFQPAAAMLRSVVCWPAIGNHELGKDINGVTGRQVFAQSFALPGNGQYYSFDHGDAHILVLDSNTDFSDNRAQYEFADRDLADSKALWKIAMFHHPLFTSGGHGSQIDMRTRYGPLFARHNVDLIVVGHDHNYQRSRPIRHRYEPMQKRPYVQIVSGGGGAPTYEILRTDDPWTAAASSRNHFVHIGIDGNRLVGSAIGLDGQAFDRFEIDKSSASPDAVAYEFIELERAYGNLAVAHPPDQPPAPALFDPDHPSVTLDYLLPNPLPEPITVRYKPPRSAGIEITGPAESSVTIAPRGTAAVAFHLRIIDPTRVVAVDGLIPAEGMTLSLTTPVGNCEVTAPPPSLASRQTWSVPSTASAVTIDGKADEPAWKTARQLTSFVHTRKGAAVWPSQPINSTVRLLRDSANLYLFVESTWPLGSYPHRADAVGDSDNVGVFLAGPRISLLLHVTTDGRSKAETTPAGIDLGVRSAATCDNVVATWEIAVPLAHLSDGSTGSAPLAFNLQERRTWDEYTLSPTFGGPLDRATAGYLRFEAP